MRVTFLTFIALALLAAGTFGSSAFVANLVTDSGNAYISIEAEDSDYACYVAYTNGKIDVHWDGGTGCAAGSGTGINPFSTYYYHDVLKITNKGTKTLTHLWLNMSTDTAITIQTNAASGTMDTSGTYAQTADLTNIAVGTSYYIGFKIDASAKDTSYAGSAITRTMSVEARSSA
jgi:hypothetical protein